MEKTNEITIKVNKIDCHGSIADGPGIRSIVYFQGCNLRCKGCHNKQTWDINNGERLTIEDIVSILLKNNPTKRVTISGGEPLLQIEGLRLLLRRLKGENFNIVLYTGHDITEVPNDIFDYIDYLKYGPFQESRKVYNEFYGSSNQEFIEIRGENNGE